MSKAQYDNCASKNRAAYDIPLYAHGLPSCAEAARHDTDGNHADDLRGMLDELQAQYDQQEAAFMACSAKLQHAEQGLAARQPAPVVIKTWQERLYDEDPATWKDNDDMKCNFMDAEIEELRAALAATNRSQP